MNGIEPKELKNTSRFDGLSPEVGKIIRDPEFQKTVEIFRTNQTIFRVIKGLGFSLALISGLLGYFLKANSEADDRKAAAVTNVINEKKEWYQKINKGILEVRKTRFLIKYDCDSGKKISSYEQGLQRFLARDKFVESFNGIIEVFDEEVFQTLLELTALDESITDVCAKGVPDDEAWKSLARKANQQMKASINKDKETLENLTTGILDQPFLRF